MKVIKLLTLVTCCLAATALLFLLLVDDKDSSRSSKLRSIKNRAKRHDDETKSDPKKMTIDDWLNGTFYYDSFYPTWTTGGNYVKRNGDGSFSSVDVETDVAETILPASAWSETPSAFSWSISNNEKYLAIFYQGTDGYAHYVRTFSVDIWDLESDNKINISIPTDEIQNFKWSPTGDAFAWKTTKALRQGYLIYRTTFGYNRDFSVRTLNSEPTQITDDGDEQMMFNGIADWLFTIEITDDDILMWWSPDGDYLAYATIDQTGVDQFEFSIFNGQQYPNTIQLPYPKPGRIIPKTRITIVEVSSETKHNLTPQVKSEWNEEYYLNSALWRGNTFTPTWKNRYENEAVSDNCQAPAFACMHGDKSELNSSTGWLGHYKVSHIHPLEDTNEYLTVQSFDGFPHVALYNLTDDTVDMRTSGKFEVTDTNGGYNSIHHYDATHDWVYFTSTEDPSSLENGLPRIRHMWRVKGHGEDKKRDLISCPLVDDGVCNWVTPSFSNDGSFVVINCGGNRNEVPVSVVFKLDNGTGNYSCIKIEIDNADLKATIGEFDFRAVEFGSLELPNVEGDWNYMLLKPPNYVEGKKYPLLVQVYSGPAYQEVTDRFSVSWKDYVASSKDVMVMSFDGRGTGFRGDEIMHMVYKKLGQYEPLDQIEAVRALNGTRNDIDETKTAIWGWSYGGYATTRTIGEDSDNVFRCGFAVAPVTRWELYHTIYTERYMWQPSDNPEGYNLSTTLQNPENFKSHRYSLFHGTRDENVHFQNSAQLSKYLIENDVEFRAFFAADDDHGMNRVPNNYKNIYKMLTHQLDLCFQ